jgi:7-cyano-7-deazaguanine synthase in queuosine biosynthesis
VGVQVPLGVPNTMSRLILFSGGVESTALLTKASKDDIVMTIRDTSPNDHYTYHPNRIEEIARAFKVKIQYTDLKIPIMKEQFVYQLWTFIPIAMMWCSRFPQITEVWYGLNNREPSPAPIVQESFEKCKKIWSIAFPEISLKFPLRHLSKDQQWKMIPKHIQPLISNCLNNNFCGLCRKCVELKHLRGL